MAQYGHQRIYFAYLHRDPRSLPLEGGHTWIRRSRQVIVDGGPLMFPVRARAEEAEDLGRPQLVSNAS